MGHGAWGMGHGAASALDGFPGSHATGIMERISYYQFAIPNAQCPLPIAQCPTTISRSLLYSCSKAKKDV
ncbi:hypothetical protein [Tolypothrix sp. VBCCA 56010]|uniref:hypothetical protein n=1 Tax=Tolypothrix sp. VBCCA 56010 TaxID=3137731 RepID=UPI003D7D60E4